MLQLAQGITVGTGCILMVWLVAIICYYGIKNTPLHKFHKKLGIPIFGLFLCILQIIGYLAMSLFTS